jgi:hypothetical protein
MWWIFSAVVLQLWVFSALGPFNLKVLNSSKSWYCMKLGAAGPSKVLESWLMFGLLGDDVLPKQKGAAGGHILGTPLKLGVFCLDGVHLSDWKTIRKDVVTLYSCPPDLTAQTSKCSKSQRFKLSLHLFSQ